jgi:hypothetical protein
LIDDPLHTNRTPDNDSGIAQQAQPSGFIYDFIEILIPKLAPVGKEQPAGQGVPCLAPVEL